jgi:hypothetical protein
MPWYRRLCSQCGRAAGACTEDPDTRVLCTSCLPLKHAADSPSDIAGYLTAGQLRDAITGVMERGECWGQNLGETKQVLLEVQGEVWRLARVKTGCRNGRFVLVLEASSRYY